MSSTGATTIVSLDAMPSSTNTGTATRHRLVGASSDFIVAATLASRHVEKRSSVRCVM